MRNLKRALSLTLASVMLLGMMVVGSSAASYPDVEDTHNVEAIEVLKAVKVMVGDDNGNFGPDDQVNRAQMAVVMALLLDLDYDYYKGTNPFWDVPSWAEPYVAACYANGIVSGYNATTYGAGDPVTAVQAASMMMRALGYFKYQSDYKDGFELATVRQASKISLFKDVNASGNNTALTRNQVAQLALNTLEATVVDAKDNTLNISGESGGMSMSVTGGQVDYVVRTSSDYKVSQAINWVEKGNTETDGKTGYTVELGEQLYQGDLRKTPDYDDFNRPVNTWSYKSTEIGKYIDDSTVNGTWTGKVTEKDLYNAVGSAAYNDYAWSVYQNGGRIAADGWDADRETFRDHAGRTAAIPHGRTSTERVLTTGNGVLTQVFVDNERDIVVLSLIDTGVARVTRVDEVDDGYEVTVAFRTRVANGQGAVVNPDNKFTTSTQFNRDDIVIYTASEDTDEIESMAVAQTVAGKVTAQKNADYTVLDGTTYNYNFAYTKKLDKNGIGEGLYNLEDGTSEQNPAVDKEVTLYLDAYDNAVAYEGKAATAEDYLFVTEIGQVFSSEPSAKVVFHDGTKATINVDKIIVPTADKKSSTTYDAVSDTATPGSGERRLQNETIYKYSKGTSTYDLEEVVAADYQASTAGDATIKKDNPTINGTGLSNAVTNGSTVFVDAKNGKAWTGYQNVTTKNNAKVALVEDSSNIAEIVFIYGSFTSEAADDDFIVLSGTGYEVLKDENSKTYYRMTSAYDVHGNKLDDCKVASESQAKSAVKGLMRVSLRDGDDYISNWTAILTAMNEVGLDEDNNANAAHYAMSAKEQVLRLNTYITFNGQNKTTFSYNGDTEFVVIDLKKGNGDVERVRAGSVDDIEAWETGASVDNTDVTGVYVMTIDDSSKDAPLAKTVLVVVPNNGSEGANAGNQDKPGAGNDAEQLTRYSTVGEVNTALKNGNVKIDSDWTPDMSSGSKTITIPAGKTLEITGALNLSSDGKIGFGSKASTLVVGGALTLNQDSIDGTVDAGSLILKETTTINANVTVDTNATCTEAGKSVAIASGVTVKIGGNFTGNNTGTLTNNGHLEVTGDITGWQNANEFSSGTMIARSITVTGTFTIGKSGNAGSVRIPTITAPTVAITNGTVSATTVTATTSVTVTEGSLNATGTVTTPAATVGAGAQATVGTLTVATSLTMGENAKLTVNTKLDGAVSGGVTGAAGATVSFGENATTDGAIADLFQNKANGATSSEVKGQDFTWGKVDGEGSGTPADSFVSDKDKTEAIKALNVIVVDKADDLVKYTRDWNLDNGKDELAILKMWVGNHGESTATYTSILAAQPYVFIHWERSEGITAEALRTGMVIKCGSNTFAGMNHAGTFTGEAGTYFYNNYGGTEFLFNTTGAENGTGDNATGVAGMDKAPGTYTVEVTWNYAGETKTATATYTVPAAE